MQNLDSRGQSSRGFVTLARSELRHFSQRNCRKKQEREPGTATDVSSVLAKKNHETPVIVRTISAAIRHPR